MGGKGQIAVSRSNLWPSLVAVFDSVLMLIQTGLELLVDLEINAELPVSDDKLD